MTKHQKAPVISSQLHRIRDDLGKSALNCHLCRWERFTRNVLFRLRPVLRGLFVLVARAAVPAIFALRPRVIQSEAKNPGSYPLAIPLAIIGGTIDFLVNFFEDIFGGSDNPPTPRQLLHGRHPLYDCTLGLPEALAPTPASAADDPPVYPTVEAAVRAITPKAIAKSSETGNESFGHIYASGNGYSCTDPVDTKRPCSGFRILADSDVASYHTHPATCQNGIPEGLSDEDKEFVADDPQHRPLYFITPDGTIFLYKGSGPPLPLAK